jgi:2-dehydro-3-deoxyphosphogluconate aldolase/(4S)-4-hydroxy-2-oxoglutarate aldolase
VHHPLWLRKYPVLPIINQATPDQALSIAEALLEGGIDVMEVTLRTTQAKEALQVVRRKFPEITLGVGSILSTEQMNWAAAEGMNFGVSPVWNEDLWELSLDLEISFFPGVLTPSELSRAIDAGCLHPKIFPIEPTGGVAYLKSLLAPFSNTNLYCLPTGGIGKEKVTEYLTIPQVSTVGGSWITPQSLISSKDTKGMTELAKSSLLLANTSR